MTAFDSVDPVRFPTYAVSERIKRITRDRLDPGIEPRGLLPDTGRFCAVSLFGRLSGSL